jgi:hypothetical protein
MDLPFDIKELVAAHLPGPDLASMAQVDTDFRPFFIKKVAPVFIEEVKRVSKILKYLKKIFFFKPTTIDIMEDRGDYQIMSYILDREVEEGEIFEDEIEYNVWNTMNAVVDLEPSIPELISKYIYCKYDFEKVLEEIDDYNYQYIEF